MDGWGLVDGWTGGVPVQLLVDGVAVNLTDTTVSYTLRRADGSLVPTTGTVTVSDQDVTPGWVTLYPGPDDIRVRDTPVFLRVTVADSQLRRVMYPSTGLGQRIDVWP